MVVLAARIELEGRLSENPQLDRLPLVTLYLTERCNSRCVTCDYWRHGRADMSLDAVKRMLPSLKRLGTQVALLSGGEPLLNPDWALIAELLRDSRARFLAITAEFARRGHRVVATARDTRTLEDFDVSQRLALDVTDDDSITAAIAAAGDIDVVIANAGVIFYAAVEATPLAELQRLFNLNTIGAIRLAQAVLPQMRARGDGKLMFMSSVLGRVVLPPSAAYAASKWALEALVEALAIEVAPFGVEATLLEPGAVSSGALDDVTAQPNDDIQRELDQMGSSHDVDRELARLKGELDQGEAPREIEGSASGAAGNGQSGTVANGQSGTVADKPQAGDGS